MKMKEEINIIVIVGPTSSGKSDFAVEIAKKENGEIISADSRQIHKDMNLGTGKVEGEWQDKLQITNFKFQTKSKFQNTNHKIPLLPTLKLRKTGNPPLQKGENNRRVFVYKNIPHYLIDFISPKDEYNVSHFKKDAEGLIRKIASRGKTPIVCGGTGFWVRSLVFDEKFPKVKPNEKLRSMLRNKTTGELFEELKKLDSKRARKIDKKNRQRLIRAIEIASELGEVPEVEKMDYEIINTPPQSSPILGGEGNKWVVRLKKENEVWNFQQIVLDVKMEDLENKIKKRLEQRFLDGMIKEVENLKEKYNLSWEKIQSFGLAYYWIPLYLQDKISKDELEKRVYFAERQYAKRQLTWLKKQEGLNWIKKKFSN